MKKLFFLLISCCLVLHFPSGRRQAFTLLQASNFNTDDAVQYGQRWASITISGICRPWVPVWNPDRFWGRFKQDI